MGCGASSSKVTAHQANAVEDTNYNFDYPVVAKHDFLAHYTLQTKKLLGEGSFSKVRPAINKATGEQVAVKCFHKFQLDKEVVQDIMNEVRILRVLDHPNIIKVMDLYEDSKAGMYYIVTELLPGGELFERIVKRSSYTEKDASQLVRLLLDALRYCHANNIVHRDIKPENLLLLDGDDDINIKLADFGFATAIPEGKEFHLTESCGSPEYVAPEIISPSPLYGKSVDIWAAGVITYILLCGYPPFDNSTEQRMFQCIERADYEFHDAHWADVSEHAKDLITRMIVVDPNKRWSAERLLSHPWFMAAQLSTAQLETTVTNMREYNARRRLKAAIHTVRLSVRLKSLVKNIKKGVAEDKKDTETKPEDKNAVKKEYAGAESGATPAKTEEGTSSSLDSGLKDNKNPSKVETKASVEV